MTSIAPPLAFALSIVGAGFFQSSKQFFDEMTHIKRDFAADAFTNVVLHADERVPAAQTLLLYQLMSCFSDSQAERDYSLCHHPLLIQTFLDMVPPVCSVPHELDLPPKDLERVWQSWVAQETHIQFHPLVPHRERCANTAGHSPAAPPSSANFVSKVGRVTCDRQRLLPHSQPALSKPPATVQQDAEEHQVPPPDWHEAWLRLSALNVLLSATSPSPTFDAVCTLPTLPHIAPLAITTLYQTLVSLRTQTIVLQCLLHSLANLLRLSVAPAVLLPGFSSAVAGTGGLIEVVTASAQESQEHIAVGLKVLRMLGGSGRLPVSRPSC
ncbi:hypothetical protein JCM10450v2_005201 [Rhodotorula kratochvilovae]